MQIPIEDIGHKFKSQVDVNPQSKFLAVCKSQVELPKGDCRSCGQIPSGDIHDWNRKRLHHCFHLESYQSLNDDSKLTDNNRKFCMTL